MPFDKRGEAPCRAGGSVLLSARMANTVDQEAIRRKLADLRSEHRDLDEIIATLTETTPFNQLQLQRLKKRKLALKDQISQLESKLLPDIIA
jgi:hypothetical protein